MDWERTDCSALRALRGAKGPEMIRKKEVHDQDKGYERRWGHQDAKAVEQERGSLSEHGEKLPHHREGHMRVWEIARQAPHWPKVGALESALGLWQCVMISCD